MINMLIWIVLDGTTLLFCCEKELFVSCFIHPFSSFQPPHFWTILPALSRTFFVLFLRSSCLFVCFKWCALWQRAFSHVKITTLQAGQSDRKTERCAAGEGTILTRGCDSRHYRPANLQIRTRKWKSRKALGWQKEKKDGRSSSAPSGGRMLINDVLGRRVELILVAFSCCLYTGCRWRESEGDPGLVVTMGM